MVEVRPPAHRFGQPSSTSRACKERSGRGRRKIRRRMGPIHRGHRGHRSIRSNEGKGAKGEATGRRKRHDAAKVAARCCIRRDIN